MFDVPMSVKALTLVMAAPSTSGLYGLKSITLLAEPGPFMLVSGDECVVAMSTGLAMKPCLHAIAGGSGAEIFTSLPLSEGDVVLGNEIISTENLGAYLGANFEKVAVPEFSPKSVATAKYMAALLLNTMKRQSLLLSQLHTALSSCSGGKVKIAAPSTSVPGFLSEVADGSPDTAALALIEKELGVDIEELRVLISQSRAVLKGASIARMF